MINLSNLFDTRIVGEAENTVDFIITLLQASTEYSIIGSSLDGTILLWNEGARRLYGYEPEEVVGKANSAILYPLEDVAAGKPREIREAALREGKWEGTIQRCRKNGEHFIARVVITPRRDITGKPMGFLLISKDISDEIRLTEALKATQLYTRSLIELNIDALITTDPLGIISDVNQPMEALTGCTREELIGTPFKNYFTDPKQAEEGIKRVLREGKVTNYELTARDQEGHQTVVSYNASTFPDTQGRLQGVFAAARDITAQKQLEHQLRDSQAYNRGLIEASVDGLITVDPSGTISDVNARLCQMTGYAREALIGTPFADYFVDAEQAAAGVKETFEKGIVTDYVLTLATQDQQPLQVSFNASVFRDPAGQVRGIFASARDITAQARLQAQLEEERAYNRGLIEASVDGLVTVDEAMAITDVNETMCRLVGRSRRQLIGSSFPSYFTEPERAAEGVLLTFQEGAVTDYVLTLQGGNGYPLLVSFNAAVFKDTTGQVRGIFASARDIRESAARLRAIINAVPDLLLVVDEDGRCVEVLSTQPHLLYTEPATFQGKLLSEVLPAELAQQALHAIHQTLLTRQPQTVEYALPLAPTSQRYFEARATPLELSRATKPTVVVLVRDITEQRLTEESLRQAQKMEAVGQLTGGMAHDFNNLLGIMLGNLDLLTEALDQVDRPELQDLVQRSVEAAERGTTLVQRLLAFARRQPLQDQPVDLNRLIAGMTELLRRTLGETIQVETVLAEDLAQVLVDPGQFETALLNLALNARDAMPTGGRLTVETANLWLDENYAAVHQPVQPGTYVLLAVSDTGSGMPAEVVEHVFEPFFTTKEVGKGSGLGLSMVYGLVKQSQGHIQLYSEVGRGTVIKIYLPPQAGATGSDLAVRRPEVLLPAGQGQTILVVEDEPSMRQLAVSMLHSLGYQTVAADTAASALQVLETTPQVMVLFTDIILPGGMNGVDLARTAHQRRPDLKVLFTSGYTASHLSSLSRHPPGVEWLSKPYRKSQLAIKLHILLDPRA